MRKWFALALMVMLILCLSACSRTDGTESTPSTPHTMTIMLAGEVMCDSKVSAQIPEEAGKVISCQWYLDGKAIPGAMEDTLHIPIAVGGKN